MGSNAPAVAGRIDDFPPEHWYLSDGFNMPISADAQRREDALQQTFEAYVARERRDASTLANVALRWDQGHPGVGVAPDVMWVEPHLPKGMRSALTWEPGVSAPCVAVEVVGRDTAFKDYNQGPAKYASSGTRELWVYDPEGLGRAADGGGPWTLQVWRQTRGEFRRVYTGEGPAFSRELGAWLVVVGDLLRVANDRSGTALWPTAAEERDVERERAERERGARAEAEAKVAVEASARADAEAKVTVEASARADAEARVRELEARLKALENAAPPRAPAKNRKR